MNIWRVAAIIAGTCVTVVLVAIFAFAAYLGKVAALTAGGVLELLLGIPVFVTLVFSIITFPYYWFRLMRVSLKTGRVDIARLARENESDLRGMVASVILGLITIFLGHFLNIGS